MDLNPDIVKNYTGAYRRRRLSGFGVSKTAYRKKATRSTRKTRYSAVSYSRNSEKKYSDITMTGLSLWSPTGTANNFGHVDGQTITGTGWQNYSFGNSTVMQHL